MDSKKIGKFITILRKEKSFSQEDLAKKLLVDRTTISKWERGIYIPNSEYLLKLQELFNVSVNEILYGERKTVYNSDKIDIIPVKIVNDERKKLKKVLIISIIVIITLLVSFLSYYFITNYNSIKVYNIYGENEDFYINDGIMILSKEKAYIKLGNIGKNSDMQVEKVRLYFKRNNVEHDIFIGGENHTEELLTNRFNYNELFQYKDIKYILNGLFLEITTKNAEKYILNLKVHKDFANNSLINEPNMIPISSDETFNHNNSVPKYIKENFTYDTANDKYVKKSTSSNYNIIETYLIDASTYIVIKENKGSEERIEYSDNDNIVSFYLFEDGNIINNFNYNLKDKKCEYGVCNMSSIEDFYKNYLSVIYN